MGYLRRLIEPEIAEKLSASGALLIRGPKACGKTETARQFAQSSIALDTDVQVPVMMNIDPRLVLAGFSAVWTGRLALARTLYRFRYTKRHGSNTLAAPNLKPKKVRH